MNSRRPYVLGLDLGTNSIGWAVIELSEDGAPSGLSGAGVRIFSEAVKADDRTPKNHQRLTARGMRRNIARYRMRRHKLVTALVKGGLLPSDNQQRDTILRDHNAYDPYKLRRSGLDAALTPFEFGRALFHLNQRRGFQSNRKQSRANGDKSEDGIVLGAISELKKEIARVGARTLGEYLAGQKQRRNKSYAYVRHTEREMIKHEFETLWQAQQPFLGPILTDSLKGEIHRAIFFQRPLKSQKHLIGRCPFEPNRQRIAKGCLEFQRVRLLQHVNNLRVINPITREEEPLRDDQRLKLVEALEEGDLTWAQIRKLLGLHSGEHFNLEPKKKKKLTGNRTSEKLAGNRTNEKLAEALNDRWRAMSAVERESLVTDLLTIETVKSLERRAKRHWKLSDEECQRLVTVELEAGYGSLSRKASVKILPYLEQGLRYDQACASAGYSHYAPNKYRSIPFLDKPPLVRNPVVQKALFEVRKVVNAVIRRYGKPQTIRIEMARELRMPEKVLKEFKRDQKAREDKREDVRVLLRREFALLGKPDEIERYMLWEELKTTCPYTGEVICRDKLFTGAVQVDHILPYSRTFDDSYSNKTLCLVQANQEKGDRTPYEAFGGQAERYSQILRRVQDLPYSKQRRFGERNEVLLDGFIQRQLNDTRYISRQVKEYVSHLGVSVEVTLGQMTATLRRALGLSGILRGEDSEEQGEKNRGDHRHHAVDAIVIALTNRGMLQQVATRAARRGELGRIRLNVGMPWESFFTDVKERISAIIVSHAPMRKIRGAFHEETAYGRTKDGLFVTRKVVGKDLTESQMHDIIDAQVRTAITARFNECGQNGKRAFGDPNNPVRHPNGQPIYRVRIAVQMSEHSLLPVSDGAGQPYKFFPLGNNHHAEILRNVATNTMLVRGVSTLEAARRARASKLPLVDRTSGDNEEFLFSLCVNDMVEFNCPKSGAGIFRVQKMSFPGARFEITLRLHIASGSEKGASNGERRIQSVRDLPFVKKLQVDPLGELSLGND